MCDVLAQGSLGSLGPVSDGPVSLCALVLLLTADTDQLRTDNQNKKSTVRRLRGTEWLTTILQSQQGWTTTMILTRS